MEKEKDKHNHTHDHDCEGGSCSCCDLTPKYDLDEDNKKLDKEMIRDIVFLSISLVSLIVSFLLEEFLSGDIKHVFHYVNFSWISIILCGVPIFKNAIHAISHKKMSTPILISLAMLASIILEIIGYCGVNVSSSHSHSYLFAAGEIAFLMGLGELLEDLTVKKCRSGIQRLVSLIPKEAFVKSENGELVKKKVSEINIGDIVVVKAGELVAVDGKIIKGEGSVDESSLTGEYLPRDVQEGDNVFGGSINLNGVIEVSVEKLQKDMTIAKMAELTIEAEGKKAPISKVADKWASIIVPCVILTSILVGIIAHFALKVDTMDAIVRAVTILVVFCPCSLVLATPTAIAAGLGNAAKNGVLIKSGAALEELSRTDTICFDKTGTITEGKIKVDKIISLDDDEKELLKLIASVEKYSEHPIAKAILDKAGNDLYDAENIKVLQGAGILAEISGSEILVLSYKKAVDNKIDLVKIDKEANEELEKGNTVIVALMDGELLGMLSLSDTIRSNAKDVMNELKNLNYNTVMLTGDNEKSAQNIGLICGINEVKHSLLPQDKLYEIEKLQSEGHKVVMVGDGINDAPSLKLASSSFAMGAMGSDIAVDTADMAILNSDIEKVVDTIKLSKRVIFAIKRNITIAMCVNAVGIVLSLLGILDPATGALLHNCTSVFVVLSSALLLRKGKKK